MLRNVTAALSPSNQTVADDLTSYRASNRALTTAAAASEAPPAADEESRQAQLHRVCRSFEGFMLGEMFKAMRATTGSGGGLLPAGRAEQIFVRQQCEALGDMMAQREPLGLARMIQSQQPATAHGSADRSLQLRRSGDAHDAD